MASVIGSDLKKARNLILEMKISILAAIDDGGDADVLNEVYDKLDEAHDALCYATVVMGDE